MRSDSARYDDGELVSCRTCGKPIQKPKPVCFDGDLGAHHPSCRVTGTIACEAVLGELPDNAQWVCGRPATFWNRETECCYCDDHQEGLPGLEPISEMPREAVRRIRGRQRTER
jgi:hypothetical protein